jgi:hypothetical protein
LNKASKDKITSLQTVRMLRKIIYSGNKKETKFILSLFPEIIEEALEFERSCASFAAIIYASAEDPMIEIKQANLTLFNIDGLYQKKFKLKMMNQWESSQFNELLGDKVDYSVVVGRSLAGKSKVC